MLKQNIPKIKTKNKKAKDLGGVCFLAEQKKLKYLAFSIKPKIKHNPRLGPIKIIFHFKNNTNNFISNYNIGYK